MQKSCKAGATSQTGDPSVSTKYASFLKTQPLLTQEGECKVEETTGLSPTTTTSNKQTTQHARAYRDEVVVASHRKGDASPASLALVLMDGYSGPFVRTEKSIDRKLIQSLSPFDQGVRPVIIDQSERDIYSPLVWTARLWSKPWTKGIPGTGDNSPFRPKIIQTIESF